MIYRKLLKNKKDGKRRIFYIGENSLAVYSSPKKDKLTGDVTYRIEYLQSPLGFNEITVRNTNSQDKIPNNLITKDLVARLAFSKILQGDAPAGNRTRISALEGRNSSH